ncbi:hypothetical protein [Lentimicrobium sp.]|nr:hypothetical protein [Lentimicrobium sp.]
MEAVPPFPKDFMALFVIAMAAPVLKLTPAPSQLFKNQLFAWF